MDHISVFFLWVQYHDWQKTFSSNTEQGNVASMPCWQMMASSGHASERYVWGTSKSDYPVLVAEGETLKHKGMFIWQISLRLPAQQSFTFGQDALYNLQTCPWHEANRGWLNGQRNSAPTYLELVEAMLYRYNTIVSYIIILILVLRIHIHYHYMYMIMTEYVGDPAIYLLWNFFALDSNMWMFFQGPYNVITVFLHLFQNISEDRRLQLYQREVWRSLFNLSREMFCSCSFW